MKIASLLLMVAAILTVFACIGTSVDDQTGTITESVGPVPLRSTEASPAEVPPWHQPGFSSLTEDEQVTLTRGWNRAHGDTGRVEWSWVSIIPSILFGLRQLSPTGLRNWMTLLRRGSARLDRWGSFWSLLCIGTTPEAARPKK